MKEEQELWDYDQSHKIKCEHDFGKLDRPLYKMPFKTEIIVHPWEDTFVQFLTCKKCGLKVSKLLAINMLNM